MSSNERRHDHMECSAFLSPLPQPVFPFIRGCSLAHHRSARRPAKRQRSTAPRGPLQWYCLRRLPPSASADRVSDPLVSPTLPDQLPYATSRAAVANVEALDGAAATFAELFAARVPPWLLTRMEHLGFHCPTPVQLEALPHVLPSEHGGVGSDVIIHAQTGSGKTLAYLLPAITAVAAERSCVQALVVVPTQELGMQVYKLLRRLTSAYPGDVASDDVQLLGRLHETGGEGRSYKADGEDFYAEKYDEENDEDSEDDDTDSTSFDVEASDDNMLAGSSADAAMDDASDAHRVDFPVLPMLNQADLRRQKLQLRRAAPRIIVGNPHRISALVESGRLRLDLLKVLIVDEFDACLLDTTTTAALQTIMSVVNRETDRQTILASATVPQHKHFLRQCARQRWTRPDIRHVWVEGTMQQSVPDSLSHFYALCQPRKKLAALRKLIVQLNALVLRGGEGLDDGDGDTDADGQTHGRAVGRLRIRAIVFVMPSRDVEQLVDVLNRSLESEFGLQGSQPVVSMRDGLAIVHRRNALRRFLDGDAHVLVGTDLAARGLDIPDVTHVFHLDLPLDADGYLHRAGRAGRQGKPGSSVVLVSRGEEFVVTRTANKLGIEFENVAKL